MLAAALHIGAEASHASLHLLIAHGYHAEAAPKCGRASANTPVTAGSGLVGECIQNALQHADAARALDAQGGIAALTEVHLLIAAVSFAGPVDSSRVYAHLVRLPSLPGVTAPALRELRRCAQCAGLCEASYAASAAAIKLQLSQSAVITGSATPQVLHDYQDLLSDGLATLHQHDPSRFPLAKGLASVVSPPSICTNSNAAPLCTSPDDLLRGLCGHICRAESLAACPSTALVPAARTERDTLLPVLRFLAAASAVVSVWAVCTLGKASFDVCVRCLRSCAVLRGISDAADAATCASIVHAALFLIARTLRTHARSTWASHTNRATHAALVEVSLLAGVAQLAWHAAAADALPAAEHSASQLHLQSVAAMLQVSVQLLQCMPDRSDSCALVAQLLGLLEAVGEVPCGVCTQAIACAHAALGEGSGGSSDALALQSYAEERAASAVDAASGAGTLFVAMLARVDIRVCVCAFKGCFCAGLVRSWAVVFRSLVAWIERACTDSKELVATSLKLAVVEVHTAPVT